MRNLEQRKLQTKLIILKRKIFRPKLLLRIFITFLIILIATPFCLYLVIYNGYSRKVISSVDNIRDEISVGVLISDPNKDNIKTLTDFAKDAFQKRKISELYIYLTGDSQSLSNESLLGLLDKVPTSSVKFDRTAQTPYQVCKSTKDVYSLSKFVTLSFKDTAIRTSFICNNLGLFTQSLTPPVKERDLKVKESSFGEYLNDIAKVLIGVDLPL